MANNTSPSPAARYTKGVFTGQKDQSPLQSLAVKLKMKAEPTKLASEVDGAKRNQEQPQPIINSPLSRKIEPAQSKPNQPTPMTSPADEQKPATTQPAVVNQIDPAAQPLAGDNSSGNEQPPTGDGSAESGPIKNSPSGGNPSGNGRPPIEKKQPTKPNKPKKIWGLEARSVKAVAGLTLFFVLSMVGVLIALRQRLQPEKVAVPTAPKSTPAAAVKPSDGSCTLSFTVPAEPEEPTYDFDCTKLSYANDADNEP